MRAIDSAVVLSPFFDRSSLSWLAFALLHFFLGRCIDTLRIGKTRSCAPRLCTASKETTGAISFLTVPTSHRLLSRPGSKLTITRRLTILCTRTFAHTPCPLPSESFLFLSLFSSRDSLSADRPPHVHPRRFLSIDGLPVAEDLSFTDRSRFKGTLTREFGFSFYSSWGSGSCGSVFSDQILGDWTDSCNVLAHIFRITY